MSDPRNATPSPSRFSGGGAASPTWWIVFRRELKDLWVGGKALYLILIYMILLGIYSYTLAGNAEVKLLPIREMISEMVKHSIALGLFICMIVAADTISGERERGTLETMLLTSASRRQVVLGKFLAALSAWVAALMVAIPYWAVLAKGDPVFGQGLRWGIAVGTVLALAMTGLGILVSMWCDSNKTSMLVNLCLFLLVLLPTELSRPGIVQSAMEARKAFLYSLVNPWDAGSSFLVKTLAAQTPLAQVWYLPILCAGFAIVTLFLLFGVIGPRLRLEAGTARKLRSAWERWRNAVRAAAPRPVKVREPSTGADGGLPAASPINRPPPRRIERLPLPTMPAAPTWWIVFKKELGDLWVGGKALHLTVAYTVVLGIYTYITARDSTLSLIPPKEMVYELIKAAMVASVFVSLIIGADSLSGERERSTLEALLLTPTSRREIVLGKFLAAASPGPVALAITIPYMRVLSQGDDVLVPAVLWGMGLGCVLTFAFTALAMFVGFWCSSNKTSLFVSLCLYVVFLLPTQLTGHAQGGTMGLLFQSVNPLAAPRFFLASLLVNNWTFDRAWSWLLSPVGFALLMFVLLFWYASPGLRLEAGKGRGLHWSRTVIASVLLVASLLVLAAAPAWALPQGSGSQAQMQVTIDVESKAVKAGTPIEYHTVVTNTGTEPSPPLIAAMNIINLNKQGDVVDPEDWSPQRTQYMDQLAPGQSDTLSWRINAILDGNYMVYMVVIPSPTGPEATSHPVASPGIHLTVSKFTRLNPGGVLPYAIGGPVLLGLIIFFVYRQRHKEIDAGGA